MTSKNKKSALAWKYPTPFLFDLLVSINDIDSYGHVNNAVYVRWLDECARAHSRASGIDLDNAQAIGMGMAVHESRIKYHSAAYLDDKLTIGEWVTHNDKKLRARREFQIIRESDQTLLITAEIDYICINLSSGRASRMPPKFIEAYAPSNGS